MTQPFPRSLNRRAHLALLLAGSLLTSHAIAEGFPSKPIKLVVPFPPGGGTDIIAREIASKVATQQGWTIVIDNKPGSGGNLGVDVAAKAAPDGYTLVIG